MLMYTSDQLNKTNCLTILFLVTKRKSGFCD